MPGAHLLPGEGRAAQSSVEEAREPRSVRSIRAQFERGSVPPAPARTARQPRAQAELAAFLKKSTDEKTKSKGKTESRPRAPVGAPPGAGHNKGVNQLIQKFGDRAPLGERDVQRPDLPPAFDDPDTFGDHTAELERRHPKTDPGQLESYARLAHPPAPPAPVPVSSEQSLREMAAFAERSPVVDDKPSRSTRSPMRRSVSEAHVASMKAASPEVYPFVEAVNQAQEAEEVSDWGAGDLHINQLFREAEETAERAVRADEEEEYVEAFELYWVVVDLYYKVIPFLSPEEGLDVHERIKMYTHRCECIRAAFDDDPATNFGEHPPVHLETTPTTPSNSMPVFVDAPPVTQAPPAPPPPPPADTTPTTPAKTSKRPHAEGRTRPPRDASAARAAAKLVAEEPTSSYNHPSTERRFHNIEEAQEIHKSKATKKDAHTPKKAVHSTGREKHSRGNAHELIADELPLGRARLPDFNTAAPGSEEIPEAPRAPGLGGTAAAHRNSLQRPISRSAVRASTNSVSRERMEEMQKRVKVMQDCLNNFTVKRKHLGPARALELQITTLNANTFGDLKRLEPLPSKLEHTWATELEVLLSMLQEIKESRPGEPIGVRADIAKHMPNLERCDKSVRKTMRSFACLKGEVDYVEPETGAGAGGSAKTRRHQRKWWVKVPVVKQGGLAPAVRRVIQEAEQEMKGVFKVAHEINVEVVKSMPVPRSFVDALPKHARSLISRELKDGLTVWDMFKVSDFMKDRNLWTRDQAKDITSSLEKVALIWEEKTQNKSIISRTFDIRGERLHKALTAFRRCQNAIRDLRRDWPTMTHTDLDMAKIEGNEDIGLAGLEAYSRALESRAYRLLTRIRELIDTDDEERARGKGAANGKPAAGKARR